MKILLFVDGCQIPVARNSTKKKSYILLASQTGQRIFFEQIQASSSLETELWGVFRSLQFIIFQGLHNVILFNDCESAVLLATGRASNKLLARHHDVVTMIRGLLTVTDTQVCWISRNSNVAGLAFDNKLILKKR